jgi:hypothetical protein
MNRMNKIFSVIIGLVLLNTFNSVLADNIPDPLNQVQLTLSAETWAKTSTARVTVTVEAVMNQSALGNMHKGIEQKLIKISNAAPWHITTFDRQKDKSDLERVTVIAEARLPESALVDARKHAEDLSKAGEKYTISSIEFVPSLADMEAAKQSVRDQIYAQAKTELAKLNALYPEQHYFLFLVNFNPENPMPMVPRQNMRMAVAMEKADAAPSITVSDLVQITAQVLFAAKIPTNQVVKTSP